MAGVEKLRTESRLDREQLIEICGTPVWPGTRQKLEIPVARLPTQTFLSIPVEVLHGIHPGPAIFLSGTIHGDELNGVEIISQVLQKLNPQKMAGTVYAVPIVNIFGFIDQSRYLPDRRDLNRCFPGSPRGSLASRLAHIFLNQIVLRCDLGIDLHTGSNHRTNLPQVRAHLEDTKLREYAQAFGAPLMIQNRGPKGSLREAAARKKIRVLLYEAGEPLRFDAEEIRVGVEGILRVLAHLKMISPNEVKRSGKSLSVSETSWVRARRSGILRLLVKTNSKVKKGQTLGTITDMFGHNLGEVQAPAKGLVIGHTNNPLVMQGDGIIHLAVKFAR